MVEFDPPLSEANKGLGVCIPDHAKEKVEQERIMREEEEQKLLEQEKLKNYSNDPLPRFEVEGVFGVTDTCMIKGLVISGTIFKGMKVPLGKKNAKVKDIQFDGRSVKEIGQGMRGALFINRAKGIQIKEGDILELG